VTAGVAPEELPAEELLATLRDQQNALVFETDLLGDFAVVQLGGGLTQTAYALVSDLVELARREPSGS
jgi:homoserine dehydrogenase